MGSSRGVREAVALTLPEVVLLPRLDGAGRVMVPLVGVARPASATERVRVIGGGDGKPHEVEAEVWVLSRAVEEAGAEATARPAGRLSAWLGGASGWTWRRAGPAEGAADGREARWVVLMLSAADVAGATALELRGKVCTVVELGAADIERGTAVWQAAAKGTAALLGPVPAGAGWDVSALESVLQWPGERWRAELMLGAIGRPVPGAPDEVMTIAAEQTRRVWAGAMGRLAGADAALAQRVAARMLVCAVVGVDGGGAAVLPCWPVDGAIAASGGAVADLLQELAGGRRGERAVEAARTWLAQQPGALAAVVDDAGGRVGVLNLAASGGEVRIDGRATGVTAAARRWTVVTIPALGTVPGQSAPAELLSIGGAQGARVSVAGVGVRAVVRPPGMRLGPLLAELTLAELLAGAATVAAPGATGWLYRDAPPGAGPREGWRLLVECRGDDAAAPDEVTIVLGREKLRQMLVLTSDGTVVERPGEGAPVVRQRSPVWVRRDVQAGGERPTEARVWAAVVQVPPEVIEAEVGNDARAVLWVGLSRRVGDRPMGSWPRAAVPWGEAGPGLMGLELGSWDVERAR